MSEIIPRAVVLLSGGIDSSTCLAWAQKNGFKVYALTVSYGQRHNSELEAARKVAWHFDVADHKFVDLNLGDIVDSALTDLESSVPEDRPMDEIGAAGDVPTTYVPARNLVLLSLALSWAESIGATTIFLGANVLDYSGYPDCRPEFVEAFTAAANLATRAGGFEVKTPLMHLTKAEIITMGTDLGMDYALTVSCYNADDHGAACGVCDSCKLRKKGFEQAGIADPTIYKKTDENE